MSQQYTEQSKIVNQLIEQGKLYSQKLDDYHYLRHEYDKLAYSIKKPAPYTRRYSKAKSKLEIKQINAQLEILLANLQLEHQKILDHPFRHLFHNHPAYPLAWASFKKKIFNFNKNIIKLGFNDSIIFDGFVARAFSSYQSLSDNKDKMLLFHKSRLKKIEKLALALQSELMKGLLFDDEELQQQIYDNLTPLIGLKKPPFFYAKPASLKNGEGINN